MMDGVLIVVGRTLTVFLLSFYLVLQVRGFRMRARLEGRFLSFVLFLL